MKTKCVYTLVSDETDNFIEQALVSVSSLRYYNPSAVIVVVTDPRTDRTLTGTRAEIRKYVDDVVIVNLPDGIGKMPRSRYMKTNLRNLIDGDFLFIDCDTVICDSIESIDLFNGEIGAVSDLNGELPLTDSAVLSRCESAGFNKLAGMPYFNSGAIFVKDSDLTRAFYSDWYNNWLHSYDNGVPFDQPALCQTNAKFGFPIVEMAGEWNCQIKCGGYPFLKNARILHYYSNNGQDTSPYSQTRIFDYIKEKGKIDEKVFKLIRNPKTLLYSALTMPSDRAFQFFNSEMLYAFYCHPRIYKLASTIIRKLFSIR